MTSFDGNDYRKRVLATIQERGGIQTSDPFEYYDLPLVDVRDSAVAAQIEAVWAFWQKQRDSPKYRGLITALLDAHRETAPLMLDRDSRRRLVEQAHQSRADRDIGRFAELDVAVERLVERFGGVPSNKVEGLRRFGAELGLDAAAVEARLAALPVVETRATPMRQALPDTVRRQVRKDLDELGQLLGSPPPSTLYDLLGLVPGAAPEDIARARDAAAARNRELRPDRRRALLDDLLSAVTRLLLEGDPSAYLDAVAEDVTLRLRPRVTAAVLVEDTLTPDDLGHLLAEAETAGLDRDRAWRVLQVLAQEAGVPMPVATSSGPSRTPPTPSSRTGRISYERPPRAGRSATAGPGAGGTGAGGGAAGATRAGATRAGATRAGATRVGGSHGEDWSKDLSAARAALRAGRGLEAQRLVEQAHRRAGEMLPPLRAVADEVALVLEEARQQWRAVEQALTARRFCEAATALDRLVHIAADTTGQGGTTVQSALDQARAGLEAAATAFEQAESLSGPAREAGLLAALGQFPDAERLLLAVGALTVQPPSHVRAEPTSGGVLLRWRPSPSTGDVEYRVVRISADGSRRPLGTTRALELEDGERRGAAPASYVVVARRAGVLSAEASSAPADGSGAAVAEAVKPLDLAPVTRLRVEQDRLLWDWPRGCTEVLLLWRADEPPTGADDPRAERRKITNTKYEIDGGAPLRAGPAGHLAVFTCTRDGGSLVPAREAPPGARLSPDPGRAPAQGHASA